MSTPALLSQDFPADHWLSPYLGILPEMHLSEFDYELPAELIAQEPLAQREASRLLVLDRAMRSWTDSQFTALPEYLRPNDLLVLNNTRVFPARLLGRRDPSGGRVEVLLVRELESGLWEALVRPGHRLAAGAHISFAAGRDLRAGSAGGTEAMLQAEVVSVLPSGLRVLRFAWDTSCAISFEALLAQVGQMPLPPYIRRETGPTLEDRERYQTVYASNSGAIAAPTAGLHFTRCVLERLRNQGVDIAEITLHVGYGTFAPVRVNEIEQHQVGPEAFAISPDAAAAINATRSQGGRIIAVGTTTTRALESAVNAAGQVEAGKGLAAVTIIPGYAFRVIDALITNFHLPQSSLFLLVCAFADRELMLSGYRHAVKTQYRFYSYGDCMFIQ